MRKDAKLGEVEAEETESLKDFVADEDEVEEVDSDIQEIDEDGGMVQKTKPKK